MPNSAILTNEAVEKVTFKETSSAQSQSTSLEDVSPGPSGGGNSNSVLHYLMILFS